VNKNNLLGMFWRPLWIWSALFLFLSGVALAEEQEIPTVDGHLGECSTVLTILDSENKPVYNAKITVDIRYGFLGVRKMSLEVGTNSNGKARVAGLPEKLKHPLEFVIAGGQFSKKTLVDVAAKCKDSVEVKLGAQ
jgi:hypothetical protein